MEPVAIIAQGETERRRLRVGDEIVARVVVEPGIGGHGLLSIAGGVHAARLPLGVRRDEKLRLRVVGADGDRIILRLVPTDRRGCEPGRAGAVDLLV